MNKKHQKLYQDIKDVLDCDELSILPKRRKALREALGRLTQGMDITSEQAGYWSAVKKQILKGENKNTFNDLFEIEN